jgi:cytochrome c oxidase subunit II
MGRLFAVVIVLIAIASAVPIVMHMWPLPQDISVHGHLIDEQFADTMLEAGISFLASQILLAFFIWKFSTPPAPDALTIQAQAGQFAFYFRYPGPDGKFGPLHADQISEANANFFGIDTTHDQDSKDDIVAAEMAIPVNKEIHLLMHAKDVGHSFYVPELRVQQDFVPGLDVSVHFTATKIGRYEIVCTQLCGLGHYNMKAYLEVKSQEDYDAWIKQQAALQ